MHYKNLLAIILFLGLFAETTPVVAQESQWSSNFNRMYLSQQGAKVTGRYDYHGGKITANMVGKELRGWWKENDDYSNCGPNSRWSGPFVLVFARDMKSFTGRFGKCSEGQTTFNGLGGDWHGSLKSGVLRAHSPVPAPVRKKVVRAMPKKPVPAPTRASSKISLMPEKTSFRPGQKITVAFSGFPARGQDWIALSSKAHKADEYFEMVMIEGKSRSGSHSFNGLPAGNYELRAYTNWPDGGYKIATKASIRVAKAAAMPKAPIRLSSPKKSLSPAQSSGSNMDAKSLPKTEFVDDLEDGMEDEPVEMPSATKMGGTKQAPMKSKASAEAPRAVISNSDRAQIPSALDIPQDQIPPVHAQEVVKGLGVDTPSIDSWPYNDFGLKGVDEVFSLVGFPKEGRHKEWYYKDYGNTNHNITQYVVVDGKALSKTKLKMNFRKDKLRYLYTLTEDDKYLSISFHPDNGQITSVEYRKIDGTSNGTLDGPAYQYKKGVIACVREHKAVDGAYKDHGKQICLDENGDRRYERYHDNSEPTGVWKTYEGGKLASFIDYTHGKGNRVEATYKDGTLAELSVYKSNNKSISVTYRNGKVYSWRVKENNKWSREQRVKQ